MQEYRGAYEELGPAEQVSRPSLVSLTLIYDGEYEEDENENEDEERR